MTEQLWRWSAEQTARAVRSGLVSSVEVVSASLARLEETNDVTAAFVAVAEDALDRAKEADAAVARGEVLGALHGVPIATKMNTDVEGLATPDGVAAYLGNIASETAPPVANLLAEGAVSIGRTNSPPFSLRWTTESEHFGTTRNPWDLSVTPGGSSGGAAVAVATGVVSIAQGNDIGGSIRYPAANCGVVGIRPTMGRVPLWHAPPGHGMSFAMQMMFVEGPLARTISDLRIALRAMEATDYRDPLAVPGPRRSGTDRGVPRVAMVIDAGDHAFASRSTPEVDNAVRQAGTWLRDAGYQVDEIEVPLLGEAATLWWKLGMTEFKVSGLGAEIRRVGEPGIRRFFDLMEEAAKAAFGDVSFADYFAALSQRSLVRRRLSEFMNDYSILLLPNSGRAPFTLGEDIESVDRTHSLMAHQWPNMAVPLLGLPGLGMGVVREDGAPLGIQLVGRSFDEDSIFRAGEVIEMRSAIPTPTDPVR